MKILIIEDEPLIARDLRGLIEKVEAGAEVLGPLSSVAACRSWFAEHPAPDLVLSDIQLSDGISFEIFENLHLRCPIIFTTAYDAYAIRAFKLNSIDYLLKPIDVQELEAALKKYKSLAVESTLSDQLKTVLRQWGGPQKKYKERFLTLHRNTLVPILAGQIGFFHKEELIYLHTLQNERLISEHQTLDEIEGIVDPGQFFRINRQYLIHIQTVAGIKTTHKGLVVHLKGPFAIDLEISREKAAAFKKWMEG